MEQDPEIGGLHRLSAGRNFTSSSPWLTRIAGSRRALVPLACLLVLLSGCAGGKEGKVTQFSTIDALLAGVYDGEFSCRRIAQSGDLGLGTFNQLDGEMIVLDGGVYQARADGSVRRSPGSLLSPFATVTRFQADDVVRTTKAMSLPELESALDRLCPDRNGIYAIRIEAEFPGLKLRSVTPQKRPYRELVEVVKDQSVFELKSRRGTLVGFRFPAYFKGLNVPGYHLHFLSTDRKTGGHVLGLSIAAGALLKSSDCRRFELLLPVPGGDFSRAALDRDRSREVQKVER